MAARVRNFDELVQNGDFKGADKLLRDTAKMDVTREQEIEIRRLRAGLRKTSFLHHNPIELKIWTDKSVYTFDEKIPIRFELLNLSDHNLLIPARGGFSWFPWSEKRGSCVMAEVWITDISARDGTRSGGCRNEILEIESTWEVEPGSSCRVEMPVSTVDTRDVLYRRIEVRAVLIPGGLQTGPFDWGMIRLDFENLVVHVLKKENLFVADDPEACFEEALSEFDGRRLLLASVFMKDLRTWVAVDRIIEALWLFPRSTRNEMGLAMAALFLLTGENLGNDPSKWIDWWDGKRDELMKRATGREACPGDRFPCGAAVALRCLTPIIELLTCMTSPTSPTSLKRPDLSVASTEEPAEGDDQDSIASALNDRFFARRYAARKKIASMGAGAFSLLEDLLTHKLTMVRAGAAEALGMMKGEDVCRLLVHALSSEKEIAVKQRIIRSLASVQHRPSAELLFADSQEGDRSSAMKNLYIETALMAELEEVMHFDMIPGFYDGQFKEIWPVSGDVYSWLLKFALDPDCSYLIRVLSIMALHEQKVEAMEKTLAALIIDPDVELLMEREEFLVFPVNEALILQSRRRNLSKYTRFSLAKAGVTKYNLAKIETMKKWLQRRNLTHFETNSMNASLLKNGFNPVYEFSKNIILDIAYNYQQFDAFDEAEQWYKLLVKRFSEDKMGTGFIAEAHYNLACLYSVTNRKGLALHHLKLSVEKGFTDFSWMDRDKDLDNIRGESEYAAIKKSMIQAPANQPIPID